MLKPSIFLISCNVVLFSRSLHEFGISQTINMQYKTHRLTHPNKQSASTFYCYHLQHIELMCLLADVNVYPSWANEINDKKKKKKNEKKTSKRVSIKLYAQGAGSRDSECELLSCTIRSIFVLFRLARLHYFPLHRFARFVVYVTRVTSI